MSVFLCPTFNELISTSLFHYKVVIHHLPPPTTHLPTSPVSYDTAAFMFPEPHQDFDISDHTADSVQHALPDARQISQVEDVVKFGWCW